MPVGRKLTTRDLALVICFTALYAVFATIPVFQILGSTNNFITAAAITAPTIGIILGPYLGTLSAALGGIISFFALPSAFFPPSFVSGVAAALCAGLQCKSKRAPCALVYLLLLLAFGFYPSKGPAWLFPLSMWFQIAGFLILISPLESKAEQSLKSGRDSRSVFAVFTISLTSTLAGQISGSLAYVVLFPPILGGWTVQWQGLTLMYPIERTVIATGSALIGAPLLKALRSTGSAKT